MDIRLDLGKAGKVIVENITSADVTFVGVNDVCELLYNLSDKNQRLIIEGYLEKLSADELKEIKKESFRGLFYYRERI